MSIFAGLDVSDKTTHLCVVDADGVVLKRDVVASDPEVLAKWLGKHCVGLTRVVLETGPLSTTTKPIRGTRCARQHLQSWRSDVAPITVQRPFALQQWGQRIAEAKGNKRARIAVARKLAVLLHSLWLNETEFRWA